MPIISTAIEYEVNPPPLPTAVNFEGSPPRKLLTALGGFDEGPFRGDRRVYRFYPMDWVHVPVNSLIRTPVQRLFDAHY